MIATLKAVLRDGSVQTNGEPLSQTVQPITWPAFEDGTINVHVVKSDGTDQAIAAAPARVVLTIRRRPSDEDPLLVRDATIVDAAHGSVSFAINAADAAVAKAQLNYYDIVYIDAASKRAQIVPPALFTVTESVGQPDDSVTP